MVANIVSTPDFMLPTSSHSPFIQYFCINLCITIISLTHYSPRLSSFSVADPSSTGWWRPPRLALRAPGAPSLAPASP